MRMTPVQQLLTIAAVVAGTMATRFLPFLLFPANRPAPRYIQYLGRVLPFAVIGLLVVYCLKDITLTAWPHGAPQAAAIACVVAVHLWKRNMLLSIASGTAVYMLLVQTVFQI